MIKAHTTYHRYRTSGHIPARRNALEARVRRHGPHAPDRQAQQATGPAPAETGTQPRVRGWRIPSCDGQHTPKVNPRRQIRFDLSSVAPYAHPGHRAQAPIAPQRDSAEALLCHPNANACCPANTTQVGPARTARPRAQDRRAFTAVQEQKRARLHGGCAIRPGQARRPRVNCNYAQ